jgi:predicted  nucleic acid-binding Zn-ribbon protein
VHPDLVAISNVWQRDAASDQLRAELDQLKDAVARGTAALAVARATRDAAAARVATLKDEERKLGRELDEYVQKRRSTQALIDNGLAQDYAAAERQLARCAEIIDDLENRSLANLEATDDATAALNTATRELAKAEAELGAAQAALGGRDAPIRAELETLGKARDAAWPLVPAEYRAPYNELRRRKRPVLVNVVDGICARCHMRVPPQKVVEVQLKKAVHFCPGCQGYLLPG